MGTALALYRGKRVVVTGDTGFKGSWLSLWLHQLGADVVGFALPPLHAEDHFNLLGLDRLIHHVTGDIRDPEALGRLVAEFRPEFLFHLAAQPLVRRSYEEPKLTFDTNVGGSVNVLEAVCSSSCVRALVYVTSDKCYRNKEWLWGYRENDELGGHDPYSASKAAAELVFSSYCDAFFRLRSGLGAASVRAGNVIGGGDWSADRIVPDCIKHLRQVSPIPVRNPGAVRPWQHVLDPLHGYLQLGVRLCEVPATYTGAWNFGPATASMRTVRELVTRIVEHWGAGEMSFPEQKGAPHEARLLYLNCDKAHQVLHWAPVWSFEEAVLQTVSWYKRVTAGEAALQVSTSQLGNYMAAAANARKSTAGAGND